jgi:dipeptidyl aminopeptidase/acylaminoacyl peptidase
MRVIQALIEANKTFDLLIMPGQPHGPQGPAGRYYREDVRRFMATYLLRDYGASRLPSTSGDSQ